MYHIVRTNLTKPSISNPQKSMATVLLDGSYNNDDLRSINSSTVFPANLFNRLKDPEAQNGYNTQEAMLEFVKLIGPHLSDKQLYKLVDDLIKLEATADIRGVLRNSTMGRCMLFYEVQRHADKTIPGMIPAVFLSHVKQNLVPQWQAIGANLVANINYVGTHNFTPPLLPPELVAKYQAIPLYQAIVEFKEENFKPELLSEVPPDKSRENFLTLLSDKTKAPKAEEKDSKIISQPRFPIIATFHFLSHHCVVNGVKTTKQKLERNYIDLNLKVDANRTVVNKINGIIGRVSPTEQASYQSLKDKLVDLIRHDEKKLQILRDAINQLESKMSQSEPAKKVFLT